MCNTSDTHPHTPLPLSTTLPTACYVRISKDYPEGLALLLTYAYNVYHTLCRAKLFETNSQWK